jgi:Xaa-Pro aminopeptidase
MSSRVDRLRASLAAHDCDGILVSHLTNIRYLTGFTGSAGLLTVGPQRAVLVTDGRYGTQASAQVAGSGAPVEVEITSDRQKAAIVAASAGIARLGLEAEHVTWAAVQKYESEWFDVPLVPTEAMVEALRIVKDAQEIEVMAKAAAIADEAFAQVRPMLAERPTEVAFGRALDSAMRELGAQSPSFETIVASGRNGARPHHRPSDRTIESRDLVVLDFGARVEGYCSDMSRTIMVGEPTETQSRMLEVVGAAQAAGVDAVRAGVEASSVDEVCRAVIDEAGWGDSFVHGTGHGVGLDIHEAPRVAKTSSDTLAAGHVVTVEPGVYLPEHGGVRIEDTVVVTDRGCEPLTLTSKLTSVA